MDGCERVILFSAKPAELKYRAAVISRRFHLIWVIAFYK